MTDNPRQDLEREAREAAVAFWNAQPVHPRFSGDDFIHGYIAAATAREKRIAELEDSNHRTHDILDAVRANEEHLEGEVLRLRAKLAAVPVEEVRAAAQVCGELRINRKSKSLDAIDRWLAGLGK